MEIFYRIDPEIYKEEMDAFGDNPIDEYLKGGDTFDPENYKWRSGVHRISKDQYENREQLVKIEPDSDAKLWFFQKNGMYFLCGGTKEKAAYSFARHFKTRFKE